MTPGLCLNTSAESDNNPAGRSPPRSSFDVNFHPLVMFRVGFGQINKLRIYPEHGGESFTHRIAKVGSRHISLDLHPLAETYQ